MNFEVAIVNPRTSEQRKILAELSAEQVAAAKASPCFQTFVQNIVRPDIPDGFMPIGNSTAPFTGTLDGNPAVNKRPKRQRREVAEIDTDEARLGPKMLALSEKQQRFVIALFTTVMPGYGAPTKAARVAGYGTPTSSPSSMATISSRLMNDERVLEGMREYGERFIRSTAPAAIRAMISLILTPSHKDHGRAVGMLLDRVHPSETRQVVDVHHHTVDHTAEAIAQLRMLKGLDVPRAKLEQVFGFSGLARYERLLEIEEAKKSPRLIEGTAVEIRKDVAS